MNFSRLSTEYAFQLDSKLQRHAVHLLVEPFAINPQLARLLTDPNRLACVRACVRTFHFPLASPYGKLKVFFKRKCHETLIYDVIVQLTTSKMEMSTVILKPHVVFTNSCT